MRLSQLTESHSEFALAHCSKISNNACHILRLQLNPISPKYQSNKDILVGIFQVIRSYISDEFQDNKTRTRGLFIPPDLQVDECVIRCAEEVVRPEFDIHTFWNNQA